VYILYCITRENLTGEPQVFKMDIKSKLVQSLLCGEILLLSWEIVPNYLSSKPFHYTNLLEKIVHNKRVIRDMKKHK
jgi:hypothetical protein